MIKFSKGLQEKLRGDKSLDSVMSYIQRKNLFSTFINYIIDSKFRRGVDLKNWLNKQEVPAELIAEASEFEQAYNNFTVLDYYDEVVKALLRAYRNKGTAGYIYVHDKNNYGSNEYWATISQIVESKKDDCDGFALLLYTLMDLIGVPDNRKYIVAGDVKGGGHCYVVYRADDGVEYPIDGCYWSDTSMRLEIPYNSRQEYFFGGSEWFRFNKTGMYKKVY